MHDASSFWTSKNKDLRLSIQAQVCPRLASVIHVFPMAVSSGESQGSSCQTACALRDLYKGKPEKS
jgi:hypothetical protein